MTEGPITTTTPAEPATGPIPAPPSVRSPVSPAETMQRLDRASKRGKLAGFEQRGEHGFRATVYGEPFDREIIGAIQPSDGGSLIDLRLRLLKKMPVMAIALIVVSIWPGVWLTDSMIQTYFAGYPNSFWVTAAWYLPLTVIPLPWMLRSMWRKSEGIAREELVKTLGKITAATEGSIIE